MWVAKSVNLSRWKLTQVLEQWKSTRVDPAGVEKDRFGHPSTSRDGCNRITSTRVVTCAQKIAMESPASIRAHDRSDTLVTVRARDRSDILMTVRARDRTEGSLITWFWKWKKHTRLRRGASIPLARYRSLRTSLVTCSRAWSLGVFLSRQTQNFLL